LSGCVGGNIARAGNHAGEGCLFGLGCIKVGEAGINRGVSPKATHIAGVGKVCKYQAVGEGYFTAGAAVIISLEHDANDLSRRRFDFITLGSREDTHHNLVTQI
jgi:hypothetical protein